MLLLLCAIMGRPMALYVGFVEYKIARQFPSMPAGLGYATFVVVYPIAFCPYTIA